MAFQPVDNVVQAELVQRLSGQVLENTLYFDFGTEPTPAKMGDLAVLLRDWWNTNIAPNVTNELSLTEVKITDLSAADAASVTLAVVPNLPGGVNSPALPNNVALCVSFRTFGRGRSARGRNYVAGFTEGQVVNNSINIAVVDAIVQGYEALLPLTVDGPFWGVVSRFSGGVPRVEGLFQAITSVLAVDNVVDSQRRRLPGRGR